MNDMDEITYWVTTKQAPCLFNYDNVIRKRYEEANCSKPKSVQSVQMETPKKKKRKLSSLDDKSASSDHRQNMYFETSQSRNRCVMHDSYESDTIGSDLDFNIKKSSVQHKLKKSKMCKSSKPLHKKNKIVTSTPIVAGNLRRSLRKIQRISYSNEHINESFEIINCGSNDQDCANVATQTEKTLPKLKKSLVLAQGDQSVLKSYKDIPNEQNVKINNGHFDDMSDVSGFTASYIRSTKLHSSKKLKNIRNKSNRSYLKQSQQNAKKEDVTMLVCLNKSGLRKTPLLNCSTNSSQNIINLVTLKNNDIAARVSRNKSLIKFIGTRSGRKSSFNNKTDDKGNGTNNVNLSFNSKSSTSPRYPKRQKNTSAEGIIMSAFEKKTKTTCQQNTKLDKRRKVNLKNNEFNDSDKKENPEDKLVSRTRSGKCIGRALRQAENSVLALSNSVQPIGSVATINVASLSNVSLMQNQSKRRSNVSAKQTVVNKEQEKLRRESLRNRSGFAACFSDSDEDNSAMKKKRFFC